MISKLPEQTVLYELYQLKPDKLKTLFQSPYVALVHSCEAVLGFWSFQHAYKFKSFFDGFNYAITEGNFLLAFSCARAMFEEIAHFHFFLVRIETSHEKAAHLWAQAAPRFRRGKPPTEDWVKNFVTALLEIIQRGAKAIQGSDYNWNGWFREKLGEAEVEEVDISKEAASHTEFRKTHINDCISELEKRSQLIPNL